MRPQLVFVSGNFNVLHPGHLRLLRFAKECGERLLVGVSSDRLAGRAAHVPEALRLEGVQSNSWVDEAFLLDESPAAAIRRLRPDIVVKGKEHEGKRNVEEAATRSYGGQLIFSSGEVIYSSVDLLRREFESQEKTAAFLPTEYLRRHHITSSRLIKLVKKFSALRVMVIGDLIVDEYVTCDPLGMSQEDPTIVVTPIDSKLFVGGAGIVAAHAAGLGAEVRLLTVSGNDPSHYFAKMALAEYGVVASILIDRNRPTTLKQRFRSKGKTLLRVSHLHQAGINAELQQRLLAAAKRHIKDCDLLVFSDFNYGCLPRDLVEQLVALGRKHGLVMVADSQSSSQVGDVSRFQGMNLVTPTEREARLATRDHESGLVVLAEKLRQQAGARNVFLKMGEEGALIHGVGAHSPHAVTDRVPALNTAPRDVAGAGDSMLIASSMALASGADIWSAAALGALAAAVQVSRVGNTPLLTSELMMELS